MSFKYLLITPALFLVSCAAMNQMAGLGVVHEGASQFDGSKTVTATPNFVVGSSVMLGAFYSSMTPGYASMIAKYSSSTGGYGAPLYVSFSGVSINIDGEIKSFKVTRTDLDSSAYNSVSKQIYTDSSASFVVPISYLRSMVNASDCRIRFETSKGSYVGEFHREINGGVPVAKATMKEFLAKLP